jgi:hypothetical protein
MAGMTALSDLLYAAAAAELERQREEVGWGNYVDLDTGGPHDVVLDGHFDLEALVVVVARAALLDAADTVADLRIGEKRHPATPVEIVAHIRRDVEALTA